MLLPSGMDSNMPAPISTLPSPCGGGFGAAGFRETARDRHFALGLFVRSCVGRRVDRLDRFVREVRLVLCSDHHPRRCRLVMLLRQLLQGALWAMSATGCGEEVVAVHGG